MATSEMGHYFLLPRTLVTEGGAPVNADAAAADDMDKPLSCRRFCRGLLAADSCFYSNLNQSGVWSVYQTQYDPNDIHSILYTKQGTEGGLMPCKQ